MSGVPVRADTMITGTALVLRNSRVTSKPSTPGSIRSTRTTSAATSLKSTRPSSPELASDTAYPSWRRSIASEVRILASSSIRRIRVAISRHPISRVQAAEAPLTHTPKGPGLTAG